MNSFFYNFGRKIGRAAIPAVRRSQWIWQDLTGSEEDVARAERALGEALAVEVRAVSQRVDDPELSRWMDDLTRSVASRVKKARCSFHCDILQTDSPNAMALPGGFIFVSLALIELCDRQPDELAFVIGHEIAHVVRGHARERIRNETALRAASAVTARAAPMLGWVQHKGLALLRSAYSRDREFEADELGYRLALAAGFQADGAIQLLERIDRLAPPLDPPGEYFSSHPPASDRIAALRALSEAS
jgi:beta-barrel assembly-enhancing protease